MKKTILSLLSVFALSSAATAAVTVSVTSNPTSGAQIFLSGGGTVIPDGSHVRIGTFVDAGNAFLEPSTTATFAQLEASFREFGTISSGHTAATGLNEGRINTTNIAGAATGEPDSFFVNKRIFLWVYNEPSPGAGVAPSSATVQQGVFATSAAVFLDQAVAVGVSLNNLTRAYGQYTGGGTAAATNSAVDNGVTALTLAAPAAVPEPSAIALLGLIGLAGLRRKR